MGFYVAHSPEFQPFDLFFIIKCFSVCFPIHNAASHFGWHRRGSLFHLPGVLYLKTRDSPNPELDDFTKSTRSTKNGPHLVSQFR